MDQLRDHGAMRHELWARVAGELFLFAAIWRWFSILHTSVHHAVVGSRRGNDFVGLLASSFALLPYYLWKETHLAHHQWTGWQGRDPSLAFPAIADAPRSLRTVTEVCWRLHLPFFSLYFIFGKLGAGQRRDAADPAMARSNERSLRREARRGPGRARDRDRAPVRGRRREVRAPRAERLVREASAVHSLPSDRRRAASRSVRAPTRRSWTGSAASPRTATRR